MLFKVGEEVRIKDKFWNIRFNNDPGVNDEMRELAGKIFEISGIPNENNKQYWLDNDGGWTWLENWLEPVGPEIEEFDETEYISMFEE